MYTSLIKRCLGSVLLFTFLLASTGCNALEEVTDYTPYEVKQGVLASEDLRIEAKDGSFVIQGSEHFNVPFQVDLWNQRTPFEADNLVEGYREALDRGAKEVHVFVDGHDQPLHGVLALNQMVAAAYGPSSRSYRLSIPAHRVANALAGNITVSYEAVNFERQYKSGVKNNDKWYAWVLWLSESAL